MSSLRHPSVVVPSSTIYCSWQPQTKQKTAPTHSSAFVATALAGLTGCTATLTQLEKNTHTHTRVLTEVYDYKLLKAKFSPA